MKIAIASCCKLQQTSPQPVWSEIQTERPDVLLLLGDNVYLDHDSHTDAKALGSELRQLYTAQLAEPNFAKLIADVKARNGRTLAIYDDHDFLGNNRYGGDHDPSLRSVAREELIRSFSPPKTGNDVYSVQRAGPVDVVVLDERFYRRSPGASSSDRDAILGPAQWTWLEKTISGSTAPFLLIGSSTTYHTFGDESWEQYPIAFERLRVLLAKRPGALLVSGDVHRNAVYDDSGVIEIVTSAVARNGIVFGAPRKNYGVVTFDNDSVRIELRSLKTGWRFDFRMERSNWVLP